MIGSLLAASGRLSSHSETTVVVPEVGVGWSSVSFRVDDSDAFCIIEGRDTVLDFSQMQLQEIRDNVTSRRNKIFLLMEEVSPHGDFFQFLLLSRRY